MAGTNASGYADGTGSNAWFGSIDGIDTDGTSLFVTDRINHTIRKLTPGSQFAVGQPPNWASTLPMAPAAVTTFAGSATASGVVDAGSGSAVRFASPSNVAVIGGYAYVFDSGFLRRVSLANGGTSTVAGTGTAGCSDSLNPAQATLAGYGSIASDGSFLYFLNSACSGTQLRRFSLANGAVSTVLTYGYYDRPSITIGPDGALYEALNNQVLRVDTANGTSIVVATVAAGPSGKSPTLRSIAADANNLFVVDSDGNNGGGYTRLLSVAPTTGAVTQVASKVLVGAIVSAGDYLYVTSSSQVRRYTKTSGAWTNVAGTNVTGYADGTSTDAWFANISGIDTDGAYLYVADAANHSIRKLTPTDPLPVTQPAAWGQALDLSYPLVSTMPGSSPRRYADGAGKNAGFHTPQGLTVANGYAYTFDSGYLRRIDLSSGTVTTFAGSGTNGCWDNFNPNQAQLASMASAQDGKYLYVADSCNPNYPIQRISLTTGSVSRVTDRMYTDSITALAVASDGFLYAIATNKIIKIDTVDGTTTDVATFTPPAPATGTETLTGLTANGGNLWVTGTYPCNLTSGCGAIYRVDLSGYAQTLVFKTNIDVPVRPTGPIVSEGTRLVTQWAYNGAAGLAQWFKNDGTFLPILGYGTETNTDPTSPALGHVTGLDTDGGRLYVIDSGTVRLHTISVSTPQLLERYGGGSPSAQTNGCKCADPVSLPTGDLTESITDITVPGRGPALTATRSYDSAQANHAGAFGYGWTNNYGLHLDAGVPTVSSIYNLAPSNITVVEETGSQLAFTRQTDGSYQAGAEVMASLTHTAGDTWTFTRRNKTTFVFDAAGKLQSVTDLAGNSTTLTYNSSNDLTTVTDPAGRQLTYSYDSSHRITGIADTSGRHVSFTYDSNGDLATATDLRGKTWQYGYNAHRVTAVTDPLGHTTTTAYDDSWRVLSQTDANNHTTTFSYSAPVAAMDVTITTTSPAGRTSSQQFVSGNLVRISKPATGAGASITQYSYDPTSQTLTELIDPNGKHWIYTVDSHGNRTSATDPLGHATHATYNSLDEPLTLTDANNVVTTNTYDSIGDLLTTSTPTGTGSAVRTVIYHHDNSSHPEDVTSVTDPRGKTTSYSYDSYGQRTAVTGSAAGTDGG